MNADDDRDVRQAFEALGTRVSAGAPSFDQLASDEALRSARRRHRRRRVVLVAAVLLPAALLLRERADDSLDYEQFTALTGIDLGEVTWRAPSDILLDVPGRELLQGIPIIEIHMPTVLPDSARPPIPNDSQRRTRS